MSYGRILLLEWKPYIRSNYLLLKRWDSLMCIYIVFWKIIVQTTIYRTLAISLASNVWISLYSPQESLKNGVKWLPLNRRGSWGLQTLSHLPPIRLWDSSLGDSYNSALHHFGAFPGSEVFAANTYIVPVTVFCVWWISTSKYNP